ncbi:Trafficking protein particle complex subunit 8 [Vitis vinifera]|uniref:Trafficking protein particle complex subunit 8 n=1 Tax=Vitis vinifera TaxID=29760 RepID=A0A438GKC5_VITVI|nr:Trafficking protein particle complex subunit 8 [Vitis vinifera]
MMFMQKIGSSGQQNATRCGLWWIEMLKTRDQYKEAASVYFRISGEEPLHSAVMLEQASYCYLFSKPPMLHKYGFHLVLSGDHYKKCDQIKHAIRTYRRALSVYKGTMWSYIKDHVHFHIGKWYAFLGMFDVAVPHMLEVLTCGHQSKTTQDLFLREFLQIVQNTGKKFEVLKLQLPAINIPSVKVIFEDNRTYASPAAQAFVVGLGGVERGGDLMAVGCGHSCFQFEYDGFWGEMTRVDAMVYFHNQALCCLVKRAVNGGFLTACKVRGRGGEGAQVSHLLFVDDTLVFCEDSQDQMMYLCWALMWFEAISGLRINLKKSELILVGCVENVKDLAAELGCKVRSLPSSYLGLSLGAPFKSVAAWDDGQIEVRVHSKDFLWGGGALERKTHLVSWRLAIERRAFWNQVIRGKCGKEKGGWCTKEVRDGHGVGWWKAIRKEWALGNCANGGGSWSLHFSRPFNDWEMDEVDGFLLSLNGKSVQQDEEDKVLWTETNDSVSFRSLSLSSKAFRSTVLPSENPHCRRLFPATLFGEVLFQHRPYHQVRKEEIFKFCQSTRGRISVTCRPHAFLLRWPEPHALARGALSGDTLPPPTCLTLSSHSPSVLAPSKPYKCIFGVFVFAGPLNSLFDDLRPTKHALNFGIKRKGYTQVYCSDYGDTFSLVAKIASVRLLLSMAAMRSGLFISWDLAGEVYMEQSPGFVAQGEFGLVCTLRRSLYGLKQSP